MRACVHALCLPAAPRLLCSAPSIMTLLGQAVCSPLCWGIRYENSLSTFDCVRQTQCKRVFVQLRSKCKAKLSTEENIRRLCNSSSQNTCLIYSESNHLSSRVKQKSFPSASGMIDQYDQTHDFIVWCVSGTDEPQGQASRNGCCLLSSWSSEKKIWWWQSFWCFYSNTVHRCVPDLMYVGVKSADTEATTGLLQFFFELSRMLFDQVFARGNLKSLFRRGTTIHFRGEIELYSIRERKVGLRT